MYLYILISLNMYLMNISIHPHLSKHLSHCCIDLLNVFFLPSKAYAFLNDKSFESSDWYADCINRGELPSLLENISPLFHTVFLFLEIPD